MLRDGRAIKSPHDDNLYTHISPDGNFEIVDLRTQSFEDLPDSIRRAILPHRFDSETAPLAEPVDPNAPAPPLRGHDLIMDIRSRPEWEQRVKMPNRFPGGRPLRPFTPQKQPPSWVTGAQQRVGAASRAGAPQWVTDAQRRVGARASRWDTSGQRPSTSRWAQDAPRRTQWGTRPQLEGNIGFFQPGIPEYNPHVQGTSTQRQAYSGDPAGYQPQAFPETEELPREEIADIPFEQFQQIIEYLMMTMQQGAAEPEPATGQQSLADLLAEIRGY